MVKKSVTEERVFLLARCVVALHPQSEDHITSGHWVDRSSGQQGGAGNKWEEGWPRNKLIPSKMMPQGTTSLQPVSTSQASFR